MLDSSENSHQGQRLEKLKALCFERGCWLIFDKQVVLVASPYGHISEHFPVEAQGVVGSLKQDTTAEPKATALPLN